MNARHESADLKFYCPSMTYKLYYENDEGKTTYDEYIPQDVIELYRGKIAEALARSDFPKIDCLNVIGATPGVEAVDGELYGTLNVSFDENPGRDNNMYEMQDMLSERMAEWSIYFEKQKIETDSGNLYVRFYDGSEPMLPEIIFKNRAYVSQHSEVFGNDRYYIDKHSDYIRNVYYNPDSNAGGQLVCNYLHHGDLKKAFEESKSEEDFWMYFDKCSRQYLTDIDTSDFADEARNFADEPCDFIGRDSKTLNKLRKWADSRTAELESEQGMKLNF